MPQYRKMTKAITEEILDFADLHTRGAYTALKACILTAPLDVIEKTYGPELTEMIRQMKESLKE